MRIPTISMAALALSAAAAAASPLVPAAAGLATGTAVETIHHKPGHEGGPPWARRGGNDRRAGEGRGIDRDVDRTGSTRVCETQYRREYDPYEDEYVRRRVQVCRNVY